MSDEDPLVNGVPLSTLRVVDLKEELTRRGLAKHGNKSELAERLREHLLTGKILDSKSQAASDTAATPAKEAEKPKIASPENPLIAAYKAKQQAALESAIKDASRIRAKSGGDTLPAPISSPVKNPSPVKSPPPKAAAEPEPEKKGEQPAKKQTVEEKGHVESKEMRNSEKKGGENEKQVEKEAEKVQGKATTTTTSSTAAETKITDDRSAPVRHKSPVPEEKSSLKAAESEHHRHHTGNDEMKKENGNKEIEQKRVKEKPEELKKVHEQARDDKKHKEDTVKEKGKAADKEKSLKIESKSDVESNERGAGSGKGEEESSEEELDYGDEDEKAGKDERPESASNSSSAALLTHRSRVDVAPPSETAISHSSAAAEPQEINGRKISPSRYAESGIVHIRGLVRPFTEALLRNTISANGKRTIEDFWIDKVKSHCLVKMGSVEEAREVRLALHNTHWPESNPKTLTVQFDTEENLERHKDGRSAVGQVETGLHRASGASPSSSQPITAARSSSDSRIGQLPGRGSLKVTVEAALRENSKREVELVERRNRTTNKTELDAEGDSSLSRKRQHSTTPPHSRSMELKRDRRDLRESDSSLPEEVLAQPKAGKSLDELFQKTKHQPYIYFKPLTDTEAAERDAAREARRKIREERRKSDDRGGDKEKERHRGDRDRERRAERDRERDRARR